MVSAMPVETVRLDLPASWQQMPTDPDELRALVHAQRDTEVWRQLAPTDRRRIELYVERFIADLREARTLLAALYTEPAPAGEGDAFVASCTMSTLDRRQLGIAVPLTAEVVLAAMSLQRPDEPAVTASTTTTTNVEPPSIVELRVGPAVRLLRLVEQPLTAQERLQHFAETFFVPISPAWDAVVVAQFATPNVGDARAFSELFGEIANTIRFYREDEPTTL